MEDHKLTNMREYKNSIQKELTVVNKHVEDMFILSKVLANVITEVKAEQELYLCLDNRYMFRNMSFLKRLGFCIFIMFPDKKIWRYLVTC